MEKLTYLVLLLVGCSGSGGGESTKGTPPVPEPTIVSMSASYDCATRAAPSASAYMSDGSFQSVTMYPPTGDGSSIPCADGLIVNSLVDCSGIRVAYFCAPSNFECTYFAPNDIGTQELCDPPSG